jgi:hypothetical protein
VIFFGLITRSIASETSDVLVDAMASFAVTIQQRFEMLVGNPSPAELARIGNNQPVDPKSPKS